MAKPEWGTKRRCLSCSAAFYDMQKSPILCPKCGTEFNPETVVKSRRPAKVEEKAKVVPKVAVVPDEIVDGEVEDGDLPDDFLAEEDDLEGDNVAEEIDVDPVADGEEER
ncbi:TIGR02300 family protein [Ferrovibrio sp.]|uniref:TIGR02300 family protein n=1 Tax=Ferrovibrio sp. TaxID=1917215 RepID=UPI001B40349B|nr:TIGR02300 family protein [Ferrovibrio sp.]MBP7063933.1 TIGR02300 family protein [Ferrovibrio sp.]